MYQGHGNQRKTRTVQDWSRLKSMETKYNVWF